MDLYLFFALQANKANERGNGERLVTVVARQPLSSCRILPTSSDAARVPPTSDGRLTLSWKDSVVFRSL